MMIADSLVNVVGFSRSALMDSYPSMSAMLNIIIID